jgi:hypothetical protein
MCSKTRFCRQILIQCQLTGRASKADAFLIAAAKAHGFTVVTHEASKPESKKRVLIPDAANQFEIKSIMTYNLLSQHANGNFTLKP